MSSEQRTSLYGAVAALLGALSAFGAITAEEATAYSAAAVEGVGAVALLISAIKTWRQRGRHGRGERGGDHEGAAAASGPRSRLNVNARG